MNRRTALKHLAAVSAGVPLLGASHGPAAQVISAEAKPGRTLLPSFSFGVASYTLRSMPLENALTAIRRVGLSRISINPRHLPWENSPAGWSARLEKLKEAGVTASCAGVINLKNDEAQMRQAFEYVRTVGATVFSCNPAREALPLLDRFVKEYDVRAAIHNHGPENQTWPSPHEPWRAIQALDPRIGLCIDVGHTYRAGADPAQTIRAYRSRVYDIHLKDSLAAVGSTDDVPVEIGRGHVDQQAILTALMDIEFQGTIWFEYEKDGEDPLPGLAESVGYIHGLLKGMGAEVEDTGLRARSMAR
jgi:sugar phosphate isomerase/epimerase